MNNLLTEAIKKLIELIAKLDVKCTEMKGASSSNAGRAGLVPAPQKGDENKFLQGDGTWKSPKNVNSVDVALSVGGWINSNNQYTYTINNENITSTNEVIINPQYPISAGVKELDIANISQSAGKIVLTSNTKPTSEFTITLVIYKD